MFALGTPTLLSWGTARLPRLVIQLLHRNLSLLVVVFVFLHVASTVIDGFAPIGWLDAVIPFRAGYRPLWLGLGAVAVDVLLAIIITSLMRVRMRVSQLASVHLLAYAMWPIALVHGLGTGSDVHAPVDVVGRWVLHGGRRLGRWPFASAPRIPSGAAGSRRAVPPEGVRIVITHEPRHRRHRRPVRCCHAC